MDNVVRTGLCLQSNDTSTSKSQGICDSHGPNVGIWRRELIGGQMKHRVEAMSNQVYGQNRHYPCSESCCRKGSLGGLQSTPRRKHQLQTATRTRVRSQLMKIQPGDNFLFLFPFLYFSLFNNGMVSTTAWWVQVRGKLLISLSVFPSNAPTCHLQAWASYSGLQIKMLINVLY